MRWTTKRLAALALAAGFADGVGAQEMKTVVVQAAPPTMAPPSAAPAPGGPGGGPGGPGRMRGGPGGPMDADTVWERLAGGTDVASVNLAEKPFIKSMMERNGDPIPASGILTKAEFKANFDRRAAERAARGPRPVPTAAPQPPMQAQMVEQPQPSFQPPPQGGPPPGGRNGPPAEAQRVSVARFGHLPKGLPDWFATYDTDGDGMVGLYEWRRNGKKIAEFVAMDLNGDGFLTADEYVRFKKLELDKKPESALAAADESMMPAPAAQVEVRPAGVPVRGQRGGPPPGSKDGKESRDRKKGNPFLNGGK